LINHLGLAASPLSFLLQLEIERKEESINLNRNKNMRGNSYSIPSLYQSAETEPIQYYLNRNKKEMKEGRVSQDER